jgi:hypothetical protein
VPNQVVEVRTRVEVRVVERAAVIMTGQPSEIEAFLGITKRLLVFSERFFWVLMPVSSVFDANASHSIQLPIKPRLDSYFGLTRLCD